MRSFLFAGLVLVGCGSDTIESYPDFQHCFDDHTTGGEMLPHVEAIVSCCLEHPINGESPACKDTAPDCINFLTDNLAQTSASTVEVMDSCQMYIDQRNMGGG